MSATAQRYSAVAVVLHWAIAVAVLFNLPLGFWMHITVDNGGAGEGVFRAFQLHKSIGLTVLALSLLRLGWRLMNPPPPLPAHMPAWEKFAAKATHWAFYVLIIAIPLSGWLYVSAQWSREINQPLPVATHWFGLFRVPALFGLPTASPEVRSETAEYAFTAHWVMAYAAIALVVLHVAAALKHQAIDRDETLAHMVPGLRAPNETAAPPRNPGRLAVIGGGLSVVTLALASGLYFVSNLGTIAYTAPPQADSRIEITEPAPGVTPGPAQGIAVGEPNPATPRSSTWQVDASNSSVGFRFVYSSDEAGDATFNGRFTRWRADIRFDPADLDHSSANVTIETASADDGNADHNRTLPTAEWFNSSAQPTATFRTTSIRHRGGDNYEARGTLTIKGHDKNVTLPFTLTIQGNRATMNGRISIDRHDFDVGNGDSDGDRVISRDVDITIRVVAARAS